VSAGIISPAVAGLGLGVALASTPGPVQAVLLAESVRGGIGRGLRALLGAHVTTGTLLVCVALGIAFVPPSGPAVRVLKVAGGSFLLWLAIEGFRSAGKSEQASTERRTFPPAVRGSLAVLLNPGAWLFLGAVASPLLATAAREGGRGRALFVVLGVATGLAFGDGIVVLLGGIGVRRAGARVERWVRRAMAGLLAVLGGWLAITGLAS
jgi:threonine/homoserine/homoserine lactone efflux protein